MEYVILAAVIIAFFVPEIVREWKHSNKLKEVYRWDKDRKRNF